MNPGDLAARLGKARREGREWRCRCPAHADHDPSLSITEHDGKLLVRCRAGCEQEAVIAALRQRGLWPKPVNYEQPKIVATYPYRDEHGTLRYQVVRLNPKRFFQRRPNGSASTFINNMEGVIPLPYRLPELLGDPDATIFIPEGEKDCDNLGELGFVATCNHGGAGKWRAEISHWLAGRHVVLLPDNDEPGRSHADDVARKLDGIASSVRVIELPGLPPKGDVSDWIAAGGTPSDLEALVGVTEEFQTKCSANPEITITVTAGEDAIPAEFSDEAIALKFTETHKDKLRYVAAWGKWLLWNSARWEFDETMRAFDLSRATCRLVSATAPKKFKIGVASAKTVAGIISLARADRRHAATIDQWDAHPQLLNTPGGVVDLMTGGMLTHDRSLYLTKIAAVAPGGDCPLWKKFLAEITANNVELQSFLRRVAGYSLTGITREHALFFCYGTGRNGKGVFLNTLSAIMGDYAAVAPMETFIATQHNQHPTDLAGLRGARLVTSQETERGRRWAESKIKALTGGDKIPARFMRQDFFEYIPQFKLAIAGNHKPGLRGVDEAIRRRFNLLPFLVKIAEPDKELPEKLRPEWPGILQWAIDGGLEWQQMGLNPPEIVRAATATYLAQEDLVEQWIDERCGKDPTYQERSNDLFANWKAWAESAGEYVLPRKQFAQALEDRGFNKFHDSRTRQAMFRGIALQ